jgi:hypothetical protein
MHTPLPTPAHPTPQDTATRDCDTCKAPGRPAPAPAGYRAALDALPDSVINPAPAELGPLAPGGGGPSRHGGAAAAADPAAAGQFGAGAERQLDEAARPEAVVAVMTAAPPPAGAGADAGSTSGAQAAYGEGGELDGQGALRQYNTTAQRYAAYRLRAAQGGFILWLGAQTRAAADACMFRCLQLTRP